MKLSFKKLNKTLWQAFGDIDIEVLQKCLDAIRENEDCELIIRKKVSWDISRMRRFFEGPVVDFVRDRYADTGVALGRGDVREALKLKFLGYSEELGLKVPVSTTSLTRPKWIKFLKDIDDYCMEQFGCGLPEADSVDIGD